MSMHPILSSQRGASAEIAAEFQLLGEAPRHVVVGPPLPAPPPPTAASLLIAFSRRCLRKAAAALLLTVGEHLETISGKHRPWSMGMSFHLLAGASAGSQERKWLAAIGDLP